MLTCSTTDAWGVRTPLMAHQVEAVAKVLPAKVGGLFMEMGTGKCRTTIELARLRQAKIDRVVWFCPVTLKPTIYREILKHSDCTEDDIYVFDDKTREDTMPRDRAWYVVGIESMSSADRVVYCVQELIDDRTMVVCDESTYIKGHHALRTKRITHVSEPARYRLILTGTPITQGIVDLYAQMRFLSPKILGYKSFYKFAANHLVYSTKKKGLIIGTLHQDWITERIRPYVYQVTKAECLSLPEKLYDDYTCELTQEQWSAYEKAKQDFLDDLMKYEDGRMENGIAIFRLFSRLQTIACGWDCGVPTAQQVALPHTRLDLLERVIGQTQDSHTVIWAKYQRSIDEITERLRQAHPDAGVYAFDGRLNERQRDDALTDWRRGGGFLVATQSLGGHGLDLTAASTVIFYANGFKYSERIQAEDRCHRIGQERPVTYVNLWANCKIEDRIESALLKKGNALHQLRREIDAIKRTDKDSLRRLVLAL